MSEQSRAAKPRSVERWMRRRGWSTRTPTNGLRRRLWSIAADRRPWYDWGHRLMALTGDDFGGSWSDPRPETWWYRLGPPKRMARTGFPMHPLSTFQIVTDYSEFRGMTKGLNEDEMYEWRAIYVDQDGELGLGHRYWGGTFYGMSECEVAVLRRYLRKWRRHDWYGARSWLYSQGLHAAVHVKVPFACHAVPPRGSGGFDHWHCENKRGHNGEHRYRSYNWERDDVVHEPAAR